MVLGITPDSASISLKHSKISHFLSRQTWILQTDIYYLLHIFIAYVAFRARPARSNIDLILLLDLRHEAGCRSCPHMVERRGPYSVTAIDNFAAGSITRPLAMADYRSMPKRPLP